MLSSRPDALRFTLYETSFIIFDNKLFPILFILRKAFTRFCCQQLSQSSVQEVSNSPHFWFRYFCHDGHPQIELPHSPNFMLTDPAKSEGFLSFCPSQPTRYATTASYSVNCCFILVYRCSFHISVFYRLLFCLMLGCKQNKCVVLMSNSWKNWLRLTHSPLSVNERK